MAGSTEYETLIRHRVDLQLAVKADLVSLGAQLVAVSIITPSQYQEIRNSYRPLDDRVADLVGYVQDKVHQDIRHYQTFIGVLMSDQSQYGDVLTKLQETLSTCTSSHPPAAEQQQPPPTGVRPQGIYVIMVLSCEYSIISV